jgi:HSP20 family molecular chaperone IbpA
MPSGVGLARGTRSRMVMCRMKATVALTARREAAADGKEGRRVMSDNKPMRVETGPVKPMVPWEGTFGFPMFHRLSRELDAMFDRFGFERPVFENTPTLWNPQLEVVTKNNEFLVKVDLPGMKKEDITVEMTEDQLLLRGERKHEEGRLLQD